MRFRNGPTDGGTKLGKDAPRRHRFFNPVIRQHRDSILVDAQLEMPALDAGVGRVPFLEHCARIQQLAGARGTCGGVRGVRLLRLLGHHFISDSSKNATGVLEFS
jgi:hypothetical protein